jgi:hypothetical protein
MNTTDTAIAIERACQKPGWYISTSASPTHVSVGINAVTAAGTSSAGVSLVFASHVDAMLATKIVESTISSMS